MPWNEIIPPVLLEPGAHLLCRVGLALVPVVLFLAVLMALDSFRLVRRRRVFKALGAGAVAALFSYVLNTRLLGLSGLSTLLYAVTVAPVVEEAIKGAWVGWLDRSGRIGFLIDGAILGFATGAGFAIVENIYYLRALGDVPLLVWLVRGLGTALMHGGTTAILAVVLRGRTGTGGAVPPWLVALALAIVIHAGFNRFMTAPVAATLVLVAVLAGTMTIVYRQGEHRLRRWLGRGFDRDRELLTLINSGEVRFTPLGRYLVSLRENFQREIVVDMLCLLRLQVELSLRAKGTLILREHGLEPDPDPALPAKLDELRHLEGRIGPTGRLAMRPICHWRGADRWQCHLLAERRGDRLPPATEHADHSE